MINKSILVVGSSGQAGKALRRVLDNLSDEDRFFKVDYLERKQLDITKQGEITEALKKGPYDYLVNCASYNDLEKSEENFCLAHLTNCEGVSSLAIACDAFGVKLLHLSTDYVFDGERSSPYKVLDIPNPLNNYGISKYKGEEGIKRYGNNWIILRTGWLYGSYGSNFVTNTLRDLMEDKSVLSPVDQIGSPLYVDDLAKSIAKILIKEGRSTKSFFCNDIYHYGNDGVASWYDIAQAIHEEFPAGKIIPITTDGSDLLVSKPKYSVLDSEEFKDCFDIPDKHWKLGLKECLREFSIPAYS